MNRQPYTSGNSEEGIPDDLQYPANEDIYHQEKHVPINPQGEIANTDEERIEKMEDELIGADLDVPGSELDDNNEIMGEEDEENNYYSLSDNNDDVEVD